MSMKMQVVLLLIVAAIGANAELGNGACGKLSATVSPKDQKILGDWILAKSLTVSSEFDWILRNVSSSHVELRLLPDNHTMMYTERNLKHDKSCAMHFMNMTIPSSSDNHTLDVISRALLTDHGVLHFINRKANVTFYETHSDCLILVLKGELSDFMRIYRREGHHHDLDQMEIHNLSECLGIRHDNQFNFDETADFCQKKYSL